MKRHERSCPFCGALVVMQRADERATGTTGSRAQRYAFGVALAASVAGAVSVNPAYGQDASVDASTDLDGATDADAEGADARVPTDGRNDTLDAGVARTQPPFQSGGGPCTSTGCGKTVCPPYGCVFPEPSCDLASV